MQRLEWTWKCCIVGWYNCCSFRKRWRRHRLHQGNNATHNETNRIRNVKELMNRSIVSDWKDSAEPRIDDNSLNHSVPSFTDIYGCSDTTAPLETLCAIPFKGARFKMTFTEYNELQFQPWHRNAFAFQRHWRQHWVVIATTTYVHNKSTDWMTAPTRLMTNINHNRLQSCDQHVSHHRLDWVESVQVELIPI